METGGLDSQIEQRMDAYRGNPQQLQKRYGANKELLDLLALQKLTSEKKAAAQDMQMKMQQQPGTIAQQREQEALALTKQEMGGTLRDLTSRTKGTLDQKQRMQQGNMRRMAQAKPRPTGIAGLGAGMQRRPQMPPPQAQGGLPAMMGRRPMPKMSGGGVVNFQSGSRVLGATVRKRIRDLGLTQQEFQRLPQDQKDRILQTIEDQSIVSRAGIAAEAGPVSVLDRIKDPFKRVANVGIGALESRVGSALGLSDPLKPREPYELKSGLSRLEQERKDLAIPSGGLTETDVMGLLPDPSQKYPPQGGPAIDMNAIQDAADEFKNRPQPQPQTPVPNQPPPGTDSTSAETASKYDDFKNMPTTVAEPNLGIGGDDPLAMMRKGFAESDAYTKRDEFNKSYEDMKKRLTEFDEANFDPNEDLNAFLIGTGGTGSIGAAMKGGYQAMDRTRRNRRNRLMDEFKLEKERIGTDATLSTAGVSLGKEMFSQAAQDRRTAAQILSSMRNTDVNALVQSSRIKLDAIRAEDSYEIDKERNALTASQQAIDEANNQAKDRTNRIDDILISKDRILKLKSDIYDKLYEVSPIPFLKMQAAQAETQEERAELQRRIDAETTVINLETDMISNSIGYENQLEKLGDAYESLTRPYSAEDIVD
tara:strand:- start:1892 stop:3841 length:1950 start_codon:yes stop_codon:yes gene_type:complete